MHHNDVDFWRHLQALPPGHRDLPSPRVCRLMLTMFEKWKSRPAWLTAEQTGHLFLGPNGVDPARKDVATKPVIIRKALAIKRMLEVIVSPDVARTAGSAAVLPDELIVGTLPPFSVGQGKEFVRYLTEEETLVGELNYLNEISPMGHIVPNHRVVLERGFEALARDARARSQQAGTNGDRKSFYEAAAIGLEAVIAYAETYEGLARAAAGALAQDDPNRKSLTQVADILARVPRHPARTFHEALQAIYIVHCALHWTVEITPLGRLDQLLGPFFEADVAAKRLTPEQAQELMDCFWLKLDEHAIIDFRHAENRFTSSDGVLTGFFGSSNFDQGGLLNQWMQQITVGGQIMDSAGNPVDACNAVTRLCLVAARRLPLNSPTLDLRVHRKTPDDVIALAADALLSGGAHPVLLNDDVIVPALAKNSGAPIPLADALDYACDGCFETMVAGATEFSFGTISALGLIERALNRGAGLAATGPINLRGLKDSWRSKPARDIATFAEFKEILLAHMQLGCHRWLKDLTTFYGNKEGIAPSPLLSALITGCLESGRDLTAGGAKYHLFSPLLVGISNAADSLYVIEHLVFERKAFSLEELTTCLATDWGYRLLDRADGTKVPAFGRQVDPQRIAEIRSLCLAAPKFGTGQRVVDELAWWLMTSFADCFAGLQAHPVHREAVRRLSEKYDAPGAPFVLHLAPGVGTFEQYVFSGTFNGASADGRRSSGPIASDLSPAPIPQDQPATVTVDGKERHGRTVPLTSTLASYRDDVMMRFGDGGPADYNIPEDFPPDRLADFIRRFANGEGGSICTFTVADPQTFAAAQQDPDKYNLLRVRMGGWTEFFITLFPDHQEQHKRRPHHV
jgi:pyruvate-formate lyase